MTSFKAVLFDLDGTLLDTLADLGNAANRVLEHNGFPTHELEAYRYFVGYGMRNLMVRALPETEQEDEVVVDRYFADMQEDYGRNWKVDTDLYPGIADMLDGLQARQVRMAILSNKPDDFTRLCVADYLSRWSFDQVAGERPPMPRKPDPAGALAVAGAMGLTPAEFCYLGDSAVDIQTAGAAGMYAAGALWGFRTREEMENAGSRTCLEKPADLLSFF